MSTAKDGDGTSSGIGSEVGKLSYWRDLHPHTFRRIKKRRDNGTPYNTALRFELLPPDPTDVDIFSPLSKLIRKAGGEIISGGDKEKAKYAVKVLDAEVLLMCPEIDFDVPHDTYSSEMIYHMIDMRKKGLKAPPIKQYRLTPSQYEDYDPMDILEENVTWSDLRKVGASSSQGTPGTGIFAQKILRELMEEDDDDSDSDQPSSPPPAEVNSSELNDSVSIPVQISATSSNQQKSCPVERDIIPRPAAATSSRNHLPTKVAEKNLIPPEELDVDVSEREDNDVDDKSKGSRSPSPSPIKVRVRIPKAKLVPSPENKRPISITTPALVPKAVAGPGPSSAKRTLKKSKQIDDDEAAVKNKRNPPTNEWVDCGEQSEAVGDVVDLTFGSDDDDDDDDCYGTIDKQKSEKRSAEEPISDFDVDDISYRSSDESTSNSSNKKRKEKRTKKARYKAEERTTTNNSRLNYTQREEKLIVKMVCEQGAFEYTKGAKMWMLMEQSEHFKGKRTWQSLKNRWVKKIYPMIKQKKKKFLDYTISDADVAKIIKGFKVGCLYDSVIGCPDYKF